MTSSGTLQRNVEIDDASKLSSSKGLGGGAIAVWTNRQKIGESTPKLVNPQGENRGIVALRWARYLYSKLLLEDSVNHPLVGVYFESGKSCRGRNTEVG